jgi:protein SCO1/2
MASRPLLRRLVAAAAALLAAGSAVAQTTLPPDESRTRGRRVADAVFRDERGEAVELRSLGGRPLIVSPIFTRCHRVCPAITASLKRAVAELGGAGDGFEVLSLSFDVGDTDEDLRGFRHRLGLPETWRVVRATSDQLLPFLDSIDFRFISADDGSFVHPNLVVVLTPELEVARYLYGVDYRAGDLRDALATARGERLLLDSMGPYLFVVGVLGALVATLGIGLVLSRARRRARSAVPLA